MHAGHAHESAGTFADLRREVAGRVALGAAGLLALATVAAVVALWPRGDLVPVDAREGGAGDPTARVAATVTSVAGDQVQVQLETGPRVDVAVAGGSGQPVLTPGDHVRVARLDDGSHSFAGLDRTRPVLVLGGIFAGLVVLLGGWRGARSLIALALSLLLIFTFLVPAILRGSAPLIVALAGAFAVMLVTLLASHGVTVTGVAAYLATATTLTFAAVLAVWAADLAGLTGSGYSGGLGIPQGADELRSLVIAAAIIATLGVLDDVAVSQSSTVVALAREGLRGSQLYARAITVGRDHLAATVNTLAMSYAGVALPALLVLYATGYTLVDALSVDVVAEALVGLLIGSIALVCAVPITTAVAVALIQPRPEPAGCRRRRLARMYDIRP